jgi:hypothetical protein
MCKLAIVLIFLMLFLNSIELRAQQNYADSMRLEQIHYIQDALASSKSNVNRWWYGWLTGYSVATLAQTVVYFASNDLTTKQDMALGAATALLGTGLQAFTPLNTGRDAEILAQLPENSSAEIQQKLEKAELMFKINAKTEKTGRSWQIHALNEAANLGGGLITWLAFKRSIWDGVSNFLLNSIITETQIWTQPTKTMKDYEKYNQRYKSEDKSQVSIQPEYHLKTYPGGIALNITF